MSITASMPSTGAAPAVPAGPTASAQRSTAGKECTSRQRRRRRDSVRQRHRASLPRAEFPEDALSGYLRPVLLAHVLRHFADELLLRIGLRLMTHGTRPPRHDARLLTTRVAGFLLRLGISLRPKK